MEGDEERATSLKWCHCPRFPFLPKFWIFFQTPKNTEPNLTVAQTPLKKRSVRYYIMALHENLNIETVTSTRTHAYEWWRETKNHSSVLQEDERAPRCTRLIKNFTWKLWSRRFACSSYLIRAMTTNCKLDGSWCWFASSTVVLGVSVYPMAFCWWSETFIIKRSLYLSGYAIELSVSLAYNNRWSYFSYFFLQNCGRDIQDYP